MQTIHVRSESVGKDESDFRRLNNGIIKNVRTRRCIDNGSVRCHVVLLALFDRNNLLFVRVSGILGRGDENLFGVKELIVLFGVWGFSSNRTVENDAENPQHAKQNTEAAS